MSNPILIDMSHWQSDPIDWAELKANGTVAIIHKATEGDSYVDDKLFERARAAMDAGLCWSTYHFLRPGDITIQMQHYLDTVDPRPGERMCLDHEDAGVSLEQLRQAVEILVTHPNNLQVTVYSGNVIEEQLAGERDDYLAATTSLWTAQYSSLPNVTWNKATWPVPSLWQYTDHASAIGIDGDVDANMFNGSAEALVRWIGPAGETPEPAPGPEPGPVETPTIVADLKVTGEVAAQILINGVLVWQTE